MGINTARTAQAMVNAYLTWSNIDSATASAAQRAAALADLNKAYRHVMQGVYKDEHGRVHRHIWSWCHPKAADLDITSSDAAYDMPADFGGLVEDPTFQYGDGDKGGQNITWVSPEEMRRLERDENAESTPLRWTLRPKDFAATLGSKYEMAFHCTPDDSLTLSLRYWVAHPDLTDAATCYPAGNWGIEELIVQRARAEKELSAGQVKGPEQAEYNEMMLAFVLEDMENYPTETAQESVAEADTGMTLP